MYAFGCKGEVVANRVVGDRMTRGCPDKSFPSLASAPLYVFARICFSLITVDLPWASLPPAFLFFPSFLLFIFYFLLLKWELCRCFCDIFLSSRSRIGLATAYCIVNVLYMVEDGSCNVMKSTLITHTQAKDAQSL